MYSRSAGREALRISEKKRICGEAVILSGLIFLVMTLYYIHFSEETQYMTDMPSYVRLAFSLPEYAYNLIHHTGEVNTSIAYPMWSLTFLFFQALTGSSPWALGMANAFYLALEAFCIYMCLYPTVQRKTAVYTIGLMFVGPLYFHAIHETYYMGQLTANMWHNPTILCVKPFCVLTAFVTRRIILSAEERQRGRYVLLSLLLTVSILFKPVLFMAYGIGAVIFRVFETLMHREFFRTAVCFAGACIPPSFLMTISWYIIYKAPGAKNGAEGMGFGLSPFFVWGSYAQNIPGSILISMAFPLLVMIVAGREIGSNRVLRMAMAFWLGGLLPFALLYNKANTAYADFYWGTAMGMLILLFLICLEMERIRIAGRMSAIGYQFCWGLFAVQTFCGFLYWIRVHQELSYAVELWTDPFA